MKVARVQFKERTNAESLNQLKIKVDLAWRKFWQRRGRKKPPYVSMTTIGHFEQK
jgi:hypothetical protein